MSFSLNFCFALKLLFGVVVVA